MYVKEYRQRKFIIAHVPFYAQPSTERQARIAKVIDDFVADRPILFVKANGEIFTIDRYISNN